MLAGIKYWESDAQNINSRLPIQCLEWNVNGSLMRQKESKSPVIISRSPVL